MFFDLNVPIDLVQPIAAPSTSKKQKGKTPQQPQSAQIYNAAQIATIESRIDLLVHCPLHVFTHSAVVLTAFSRIHGARFHTNDLQKFRCENARQCARHTYPSPPATVWNSLSKTAEYHPRRRLRERVRTRTSTSFSPPFDRSPTVQINANTTHFLSYDILSLTPTNATTFSLACLTHTVPSPLTAHIISLPLTLPRFNFYLKHTLIRTALKNGAAFEITYAGSLGAQHDAVLADAGFAEAGQNAKRNWWANAREVVRVTKGKGFVTSSGVANEADLRAPRDIQNLYAPPDNIP
ncbi:hypothetical protein AX15_000360 [Amanita polypyramis BW_CC]|nr:hypothetical protein AX15_000360 [Amanita polypyramis BW_CC]